MSENQNLRHIPEEEWIVKYRAALDAMPVPKTRSHKLRTILGSAYANVLISASRIFDSWLAHEVQDPKGKLVARIALHQPKPQNIIVGREGVEKRAS